VERQHKRRAVFAAIVLAGMFVPMAPAMAQPQTNAGPGRAYWQVCRAVQLPVPDGAFGAVLGGDPTGRYLVGKLQDRPEGALWQDGRYSKIDTSSIPNAQVDFHDVNSKGVVVGERMTDYQSFHTDAFTWSNGVYTFLPPLRPGDTTQALGINSRGDVVGNSVGDDRTGWHPVVWPADAPGTVRALPFPAGHSGDGLALGIDEDGTVVGYLSPQPPGTPFVWPAKGTPHALPVPTGGSGIAAVVQGGMVGGNVWDPASNSSKPALWNLRTGALTVVSQVSGDVLSVNAKGTLGLRGSIVHTDGRVSSLGAGTMVNVVADNGVAAGATQQFQGQAVRWFGC
jgi:hypothetical protein